MRAPADLSSVTRVIIFSLRVFGLWQPARGSWTTLYAFYGIAFCTTFSGIYTLFMCINLFFIPDLHELTDASYMTLTELALLVKIVNFYILNRNMQALYVTMKAFTLENDEEREFVALRVNFFFRITIFYYSLSNGAALLTEISSALSADWKLPYNGWYPYLDWRHKSKDYWIAFTYQCLGMTSTCNMNVTIDTFAIFFMYMISVQMEVLGKRLSAMGYANTRTGDSREKAENLKRFKDQVKLHQVMLESTKIFEGHFAVAFFSQISVSGMVICSLTNELAHVSSHFTFTSL